MTDYWTILARWTPGCLASGAMINRYSLELSAPRQRLEQGPSRIALSPCVQNGAGPTAEPAHSMNCHGPQPSLCISADEFQPPSEAFLIALRLPRVENNHHASPIPPAQQTPPPPRTGSKTGSEGTRKSFIVGRARDSSSLPFVGRNAFLPRRIASPGKTNPCEPGTSNQDGSTPSVACEHQQNAGSTLLFLRTLQLAAPVVKPPRGGTL